MQKSEGVQGLARGRLSVSLPGEGGSLPFLPDNFFLPFVMSGTLGTPPHLGEKILHNHLALKPPNKEHIKT